MKLVLLLCLLTTLAAYGGAALGGLDLGDQIGLYQIVGFLLACAFAMRSLRFMFVSLAVMFHFIITSSQLMYVAGLSPFALADAPLARMDAMVGLDASAVARYVASVPWLSNILAIVYASGRLQTLLILVWIGAVDRARTILFMQRFMICALITCACFAFVPAATFAPDSVVAQELLQLRAGETTTVGRLLGIIAFPSFHTIAALLFVATIPRWPMIVLNALVIVSTIPIGMHYGVDLLGGVLVCAFVFPITARYNTTQASAAPDAAIAAQLELCT